MSTQLNVASELHLKEFGIRSKKTVSVSCQPLSSLMAQALPAPHSATFFSLDVEGAEEQVLRTVDPAAFSVSCTGFHAQIERECAMARLCRALMTRVLGPHTCRCR